MKKIIIAAFVFLIILSMSAPAFAAGSIKELNIKIPDELMNLINKANIDELSASVKSYLDTVRNMTDDELYTSLRTFCDKYRVELSDTQLESLAKYIKKAVDFNTDDIKNEIESVRKKVSTLTKILDFLKSIVTSIVEAITKLFDAVGKIFA